MLKQWYKDPRYVMTGIIKRLPLHWMKDDTYLRLIYWVRFGEKLDLNNPQTFNQKLQWLKLYDRRPEYTVMVDKYAAKKWVADRIDEEYVVPTLGVWNHFDEIDFDDLPNQFVLKCTHDSGGLVIIKDKSKLDKKAARQKIENCLRRNFFYAGREWAYKDVPPRIIAEPYLTDESGTELKDYKIMCFNGEAKCSFVCSERCEKTGLKVTFFDNAWNTLPFERQYPKSESPIPKPLHFEKMKELAQELARESQFLRVDFYEVNQKLYVGELTLYPGCGFEVFTPREWDARLGGWLDLGLTKRGQ